MADVAGKIMTGGPGTVVPARSRVPSAGGPRYWRSFEEMTGDSAFLQKIGDEFAVDADLWLDPTSRRNFLRIMGASLALAGVVGCSDFPDEKIIPYVNPPESVVPGKPTFYATAYPFSGFAQGVLVESHEGRPTKIEGNPQHPATLGASNVFMQASVLDLYDPDRSKMVMRAGVPSSWGIFSDLLGARLQAARGNGQGLRLLTRTVTSPTFAAQLAEFKKMYPAARWHVHDPVANAGCSARNGGAPGRAVYDFSKADVILSLDADFLFSDPGSLAYARQFIDGRRRQLGIDPASQSMNRLYALESTLSITGSMADHRLTVQPSLVLQIAQVIAGRLGAESAHGAVAHPSHDRFIRAVAQDLQRPQSAGRAGGVAVVVAGDHQPAAVQALAFAMNQALGSIGKAVRYIPPVEVAGAESLESLVADMASGSVDTLLILGGNPAYDAPADVPFRAQLERLTTAVDAQGQPAHFTARLGSHEDETSFICQWHIPESHYLEAWGDARAFDGTASIIQPLILPLSSFSRSPWEMMETILGRRDRSGYEAVRAHWQSQQTREPAAGPSTEPATSSASASQPSGQQAAADFDQWWQGILRKGVIEGSAAGPVQATAQPAASLPVAPTAGGEGDWELVFRPDPGVWDGQFANNPWLQELPRPFTKLVWDNAALISYQEAEKLGLQDGSGILITLNGRTLSVPILRVPGIPDHTLTLTLGYGRTRGGHVADAEGGTARGYDAHAIRTAAGSGFATGARVSALPGASRALVTTRSHHAMADLPGVSVKTETGVLKPNAIEHPGMPEEEIETKNRRLVRSGTLEDFRRDHEWVTRLGGENELREKGLSSEFPGRKIHLSIYPDAHDGGWDYSTGYQWAMSIDQNACIGCNACVIACQAENNIPVVGKEECGRQREMHWIRIDDWFGAQPGESSANTLQDPQIIHMPVPCQHCENAPCEVVCPVGATTHSAEGLNEMTYNRCIGTRYCSNNCPYKVRRFNFFLYADYTTPTRALQYNPDVTVRSRGVMEKCTYCVQRLNHTRMEIEKLTVRLEERAKTIEAESPSRAATLRASIPAQQKQILDQLQTACQQACPTEAIVFGDRNDPESRVTKLKRDPLDYTLLTDLTTQPRTSYMARLRNPNPSFATGQES